MYLMWLTVVLTIVSLTISIVFGAPEPIEELKIKVPATMNPRILGGKNADIEQYPYAIQLFRETVEIYEMVFMCGGTILTRRHILTASHCVTDEDGGLDIASLYYVRLGTTVFDFGGSRRQVKKIIVHPKFDSDLATNDVAILVLKKYLTYSKQVDAACLPPQGYKLKDNVLVTAVGWGDTDPNSVKVSEVLNHVTVVTISFEKCFALYKKDFVPIDKETMFCAGLLGVGGKDTCCGDSGGPLVYNGVVVGVTSWGADQCGDPSHPGVYTTTSAYIDWMKEVVASTGGFPSARPYGLLLITIFIFLTTFI